MHDKELQEILDKIKEYAPNTDTTLVEKAYYLAKSAHEGVLRKSGEPYIIHPIAVANILVDMQLDIETISAGLLHDVIEDTDYTYDDIKEMFSKEVADLVDGVTKLGQIKYQSKEETQAENLRKMFLAMAKDIRVILIKLADRLHNMRTLKYMPEEKAKYKAKETLEIYGGIAHRLGISKIKWELEDLALRYIDPDGYYDLVDKVSMKRSQREEYINKIVKLLQDKFKEVNINCEVYGRPKHFYSIYKKMQNKHKTFEEIFDFTDGQECLIYKGEFEVSDNIIYIPDIYLNKLNLGVVATGENLNDILKNCYTGNDFLKECNGYKNIAKALFDFVDWQHPNIQDLTDCYDEEEFYNEFGIHFDDLGND